MIASHGPDVLKRFRKTAWPFQRTFQTPLKNLPPFVATIIAAHGPLESGCISIESAIVEPSRIVALLAAHSLPPSWDNELTLTTENETEIAPLLEAALADPLDFLFVPKPARFVCYADHDEYATFYAHTKANLGRVVHALAAAGFTSVDYRRD